jgi:hypothetical protein
MVHSEQILKVSEALVRVLSQVPIALFTFYFITSSIIPSEQLTSSFSECSLIDFLQYEQKIE